MDNQKMNEDELIIQYEKLMHHQDIPILKLEYQY